MPDYKTMYFKLAAKVADAVELLVDAQRQGEESYISDKNTPPIELVNMKNGDTEAPPD